MTRYRTLRRFLLALAVSAGVIAAAAPASAGLPVNHSQPLSHLG